MPIIEPGTAASSARDAQSHAHCKELRRLEAKLAAHHEQSNTALEQQQLALAQAQHEGDAAIARLLAELADARQQNQYAFEEQVRSRVQWEQQLTAQHAATLVNELAQQHEVLEQERCAQHAELEKLSLQHAILVAEQQQQHTDAVAAAAQKLQREHATALSTLDSHHKLALSTQEQLFAETIASNEIQRSGLLTERKECEARQAALAAELATQNTQGIEALTIKLAEEMTQAETLRVAASQIAQAHAAQLQEEDAKHRRLLQVHGEEINRMESQVSIFW